MPTVFTERPAPYESIPHRIRWTRQQCETMREAGILAGRYELIDGQIIEKMGQKPPHAFVLTALLTWLTHLFGAEHTQIQATINLSPTSPDYDEPEPDVAVTKQPYTAYAERHPGAEDLLLVAEVSDTTLRFDLNAKATLYAKAGIPEYWVVDIAGRRIIAHRQAGAEGYAEVVAYGEAEEIATLARPEALVKVAALLPPA